MSPHAFRRVPMSRRRFLKKSALAAGALALPLAPFRAGAAGPLKQISLTLDWLYQGPNAGFLLAQEKGFYRQAGLHPAITPGKGSGRTPHLTPSQVSHTTSAGA